MKTKEELQKNFIAKAEKKYGVGAYDYSKVNYTNNSTKVTIICPIHGEFQKTPKDFLRGRYCPQCKREFNHAKRYNTEIFIEKAKQIHPEYDYSECKYIKTNVKTSIICPVHGPFLITPSHLLGGEGCPQCRYVKSAAKTRRSLKDVIDAANEVHKNKYDYSLIKEYKNDRIKYPIICPEHGVFTQAFNNHIKAKQGCPECGKWSSVRSRKITFDEFVNRADAIHNGKYKYLGDFKSMEEKIPIECSEHGVFYQTPSNHLQGQGCPKCGKKRIGDQQRSTTPEFVQKAQFVHGNKYDYSKTEYHATNEKIEIICPKHGAFWQEPGNHLQGNGCPKCAPLSSRKEDEIETYLISLIGEENVIKRDRIILKGKELDLYLPQYKIAIEFDGLFWHNELNKETNYHLNKTEECKTKGIRLIHIFEDEWIEKQEIVKSMLANILGQTKNRIYARKCSIKEVTPKEAGLFLDTNHIQGKCGSKIKLGLYYDNELVSLMTFGQSRHFIGNGEKKWELLRFCNKLYTNVIGGASKLFHYFVTHYDFNEIISYADRRFSVGNLYYKLGFELYNVSRPNYYYVKGVKRIYRYNLRKQVLVEKYGCSVDMTEKEFCYQNHWYRIYDCGMLCFVWKNKKLM